MVKMWSGIKNPIIMAVLIISVMSVPAAAQLADTAWPMFHHDPNHTGLSQYHGPDTPAIKWIFSTGNKISGSSVIGEDGTIYIGTRNYQKGNTGSKLYAIYPNGTGKWQKAASHFIDSTPAVASDGTVYVGSWDKCLYAIYPNGTRKWQFCTPCGGFVLTSPAIAQDGTIYIGSNDKNLYAIYPNGTEKWNYPTGQSIQSSPAIGPDGIIYVGSYDKKLYAIYPNGTGKWNYCTGQSIQSSPAIGSDGIIYVGSCDKKLYAFYPNGTLNWAYTMGGRVESSPAIDADGTIYVGSKDRKLYAIYPNGTLNWAYTMGGEVESSPAIDADGTIYVGSKDGYVYAINPNNTLLWRYYTGNEIRFSSPAIASDGTVYIGNWGGNLYAFGPGIQPNRPPVLDPVGDKTVNETETVMIDLDASDPDGDTLTYSCNRTDLFTDFDSSTGTGNWTTDYDNSGTYRVDFGVSDGNGGIANETIMIMVLDSNRPPVLDPVGDKTVNETETVMIDLNASDQDGDTLTYSCNRTDLFTDFDPAAGTGNWTTGYDDSGTYQVDFGVSDGNGGTANETIRIDVLDANRAPVLDPVGDKTIDETETVIIDLNASDLDGDTLTYSCNRTTDLFTDFDPATGTGNWSTGYSDFGTYWIDFGVSDGNGGFDNETIQITVSDANRQPILDPVGNKAISETETVAIDLNASDPDGDSLTYSCNRTDLFTDFDPATGTGNWTTGYGDSGTYQVDFSVSDGNGGTDNETILITVLDSKRPPVLDPVGDRTVNENETVMIDLNATDQDGDSLTYSCNRTDLFTDFNPATGIGNWTTNNDDSGTYQVDFGVSDGNGGTDNETILITVLDSNRQPSIDPIGESGCRKIGEQFDILINITPMDIPLMGVQFDLHFDASVLHAETVALGDMLTWDGALACISHSDIDNSGGIVSFAAARQGTSVGVTHNDTFAIVHFTAIKQNATSELTLTNVLASDNSTPVVTYELKPVNGSIEVCGNLPPVVVAKSRFTYNNIAAKGISKAYFNGADSCDPNGTITYWRWWVDDGSSLTGEIAEHLFKVPMYWQGGSDGYYVPANVTLTVTDDGIPLMDNSTTMDVTVWIAGDATGDGRVNIADAVTFGMQFGAACSIDANGLHWYDNPEGDKADLNNDNRVNIGDAMLLGTSWGHTAW